MLDKLIVLDANLAETQKAVREAVAQMPEGTRYLPVVQRLLRVEACLFAAHLELADAASAAKCEGMFRDVAK